LREPKTLLAFPERRINKKVSLASALQKNETKQSTAIQKAPRASGVFFVCDIINSNYENKH
jgi:hypothetical protein